jgi:predicted permease
MLNKSNHDSFDYLVHEKKISHKIFRIFIYFLLILIIMLIPALLLKLLNDRYHIGGETVGITLTFAFYAICYLGYKYFKNKHN